MNRIIKKSLFGLFGALLLASIVTVLLLFFPPAFKFGLKTAGRFLPVAVNIEDVRHVPGRLRLSGLRIATPMGTSCEMAALEITYRPLSLALGRIEISALEVRNPSITILRFPEGRFDLLEPSAESGTRADQGGETGTSPWGWLLRQLRIRSFVVTGGSVRVHSPDAGLSLAWNSLDLEGSFSGHPLGGSLRVRRGRIRAVNKPYPPLDTTTQGEASLSGGRIRDPVPACDQSDAQRDAAGDGQTVDSVRRGRGGRGGNGYHCF